MAESALSKFVPKYTGKNFDAWSRNFQTAMVELDRWEFFLEDPPAPPPVMTAEEVAALSIVEREARDALVQRYKEYLKKEIKAYGCLFLALPTEDNVLVEQFRNLLGCAKAAWAKLKASKVLSGISAKMALRRKINHITNEPNESIRAYLSRMDVLWRENLDINAQLELPMFLLSIITGLPDDWEAVAYDLNKIQETWTKDMVYNIIIAEDDRRKERDIARGSKAALAAKHLSPTPTKRSIERNDPYPPPKRERYPPSSNFSQAPFQSGRGGGRGGRNGGRGGRGGRGGFGRGRGGPSRTNTPQRPGSKPWIGACWYCKEKGHGYRTCSKKPPGWEPSQKSLAVHLPDDVPIISDPGNMPTSDVPEDNHYGWVTTVMPNSALAASKASMREWVVDSGCTIHMCPYEEYFESISPSYNSYVIVGDGKKVPIKGQGTVWLQTNEGHTLPMHDVQFCPDLHCSLLSVQVLDKKDFGVTFKKGVCIISNDKNEKVATALQRGGLYHLQAKTKARKEKVSGVYPLPNVDRTEHVRSQTVKGRNKGALDIQFQEAFKANASLKGTSGSLNQWHGRLTHVSTSKIVAMGRQGSVKGMDIKDTNGSLPMKPHECPACVQGKMQRTPFGDSEHRAKEKLEEVHCDLAGKMHITSKQGSNYALVIIDDYSRYTWVFGLKSKADVATQFRAWMAMAERQSSHQLKSLRTDKGGEFHPLTFLNELTDLGVIKKDTEAFSPQQNGVVEKANKDLIGQAKASLASACLPPRWWEYALLYVCWVKNRVITTALKGENRFKTPHEMWTGEKPNISMAKPFGCMAQMQIPKELRKKWDHNSVWGMFIGMSPNTKGWLFWLPDYNQIKTSRDCTFYEDMTYDTWKAQGKALVPTPQASIPLDSSQKGEESWFYLPEPEPLPTLPKRAASPLLEDVPEDEGEERDDVLLPEPREEVIPMTIPRNDWRSLPRREPSKRLRVRSNWAGSSVQNRLALCMAVFCMVALPPEPKTVGAALSGPDYLDWKDAMQKEYDALMQQGTWVLVDPPPNVHVIDTKWIFRVKTKGDGTFERFKARLVARGFKQIEGLDYDETYAPVGRYTTSRILLAMACEKDWEIHQMDVDTAFLYGEIEEEIYISQPEGFEDGTPRICRILKALYGLKQSPRQWNKKLHEQLLEMGWIPSLLDPALYHLYNGKDEAHMLTYVDDLLICCSSLELLARIKQGLTQAFKMKDLGEASYYLALNILRDRKSRQLWLGQPKYIANCLEKYKISKVSNAPTPLPTGFQVLEVDEARNDLTPREESMLSPLLQGRDQRRYQSIIGALNFAAQCTRPDISYAVGKLSQVCHKPRERHMKAALRCLYYLAGTPDVSLHFQGGKGLTLKGFSDADWAGCHLTRRSTSGFIFTLAGAPITWSSKRQSETAMSSCEAEYIALTAGIKEAIWLRDVLEECSAPQCGPTTMLQDNQSTILLSQNPVFHSRTKHIGLAFHYAREKQRQGHIEVTYVPTKEQGADYLTKNTPVTIQTTCMEIVGQGCPSPL